jgi:hypothetical protein
MGANAVVSVSQSSVDSRLLGRAYGMVKGILSLRVIPMARHTYLLDSADVERYSLEGNVILSDGRPIPDGMRIILTSERVWLLFFAAGRAFLWRS